MHIRVAPARLADRRFNSLTICCYCFYFLDVMRKYGFLSMEIALTVANFCRNFFSNRLD